MSVKQLFELQCLEQDLEANEMSLAKFKAAIGESLEVKNARANLLEADNELVIVKAKQKTTEYSLTDISAKIDAANESLYSGRVKNPKELQNLQHEINSLQSQRNLLEETDLSLMEKVEAAETRVKQISDELSRVEQKWRSEQEHLLIEVEALKQLIQANKRRHGEILASIASSEITLYNQLKKTRVWGITPVEQGTCGRCRLSLSTAEMQRARAGQMVSCSSCGRLLYFE